MISSEKAKDDIVAAIYCRAGDIALKTVRDNRKYQHDFDYRLDNVLTSRIWGFPVMFFVIGVVFWITISGANVPSEKLAALLFRFEGILSGFFFRLGMPVLLHDVLVLGLYRTVAWVVSVMLPPMAIFFPLFTLLEDFGYLPRVAFNLDRLFKKAGAHGKQALTMCMGFGCNAAGVISCRIINSPREKMIAILTNNYSICNGRFPTLIALSIIFIGGGFFPAYQTFAATAAVIGVVILGIVMMFFTSWLLSRTILKGMSTSFTLELPPYRRPQLLQVILRSVLDRTIFVLGRAVVVAAPAGVITWVLANTYIGGSSVIEHLAGVFQPLGNAVGLDGYILLAFLLGLPANDIVVPVLLMSYLSTGMLIELESLSQLSQVLVQNGWTWVTAVNMLLFTLMHSPCGTTLITIYKETGKIRWVFIAAFLPTAFGLGVCFLVKTLVVFLGH